MLTAPVLRSPAGRAVTACADGGGHGPVESRAAEVAQWCARQQWPVFPLQAGHKTPRPGCERCRHSSAGYVAHAAAGCPCLEQGRWCHGFYAATTDAARISRWWSERPVPGVGVSTGAAGLVVVDVDCHVEGPVEVGRLLPAFDVSEADARAVRTGWDTWLLLARLAGGPEAAAAVRTLTVRTPSGGRHLWFTAPRGTRWASSAGGDHGGRALGWQLDVRAEGGYIVAPGTRTAAGVYQVVGDVRAPARLPGWLAGALERTGHLLTAAPARARPAAVPNLARQASGPASRSAWARAVAATALAEVAACERLPEGSGWSSKLNRAAYTMGGLVAAGLVSSDAEARRALVDAALAARPQREREAHRIIQSGLVAGQRRPLNPTKDR
ncbi:bifunctional DNA primase/polymerase [Streptomyces sp. NPDC001941]|uniref:bifunctional DNA primase/polymerase n=1 Tax=Streptomyces sp. NPDC001941 TaxID=3154659 RepID=UPI00332B51AF